MVAITEVTDERAAELLEECIWDPPPTHSSGPKYVKEVNHMAAKKKAAKKPAAKKKAAKKK